MDYSAWDTQSVPVTSLNLDSENPRLPELGHEASQREIIAELVKHEGIRKPLGERGGAGRIISQGLESLSGDLEFFWCK
jgi:hypothetical protein